MWLLLFGVAFVLIAASIYVDYRWKRWIDGQRKQRERLPNDYPQ
jgi:hypothetical protein